MISCQAFRTNLRPGSDDAATLEHLRGCDACLDFAVSVDPDNFFRALGGGELEPPGGIDAFTSGVMAEIRLRQTEGSAAHRFLVAPRRLAAAAAITVTLGVAALVYNQAENRAPVVRPAVAVVTNPVPVTTKPVVETYDSHHATIVEMPTGGPHDAKLVMIFDESLPADL